jgi:hypothetical protein
MAVRPGRAAFRLLLEPDTRARRQLVHLHGMGKQHPTCCSRRVHVSGSRHVVRLVSWSKTESARAKELLVVRDGDLSCEASSSRERVGEAPN